MVIADKYPWSSLTTGVIGGLVIPPGRSVALKFGRPLPLRSNKTVARDVESVQTLDHSEYFNIRLKSIRLFIQ